MSEDNINTPFATNNANDDDVNDSLEKYGSVGRNTGSAQLPIALVPLIFSTTLAIWSTVISTKMLNDERMADFPECSLWTIATQLGIYGMLTFISIGVAFLLTCLSIVSQICFCCGTVTKKKVFYLPGFCSLLFSCISVPLIIGLWIACVVFFIIVNVGFWGSECTVSGTAVIAEWVPYIKPFLIVSYVFIGIPFGFLALVLALLPCIFCILICVICFVVIVVIAKRDPGAFERLRNQ